MEHIEAIQEILDENKGTMPISVVKALMNKSKEAIDNYPKAVPREEKCEDDLETIVRQVYMAGGLTGERLEQRVRERLASE
jgi:hypothetical protein